VTQNRSIPFVDLVTPHQELQEELVEAFRAVLATAGFVGGPAVEEFEREFAADCDAKHCVGVASGTDALNGGLGDDACLPGTPGLGNGDTTVGCEP